LKSTPGQGSTFTLYLPQKYPGATTSTVERAEARLHREISLRAVERQAEAVEDDRDTIQEGDMVLLVVEDDPHYARVIADLARDHDFKVLIAMRGIDALALASEYKPAAITLDVFMPDMLGWSVLAHLKRSPETRHIPVQMVTLEEDRQHGLARGAFSFLTKPVDSSELSAGIEKIKKFTQPRRKTLVIVEDNEAEQLSITELLGHDDIDIVTFSTGQSALAYLKHNPCDCVVLDLKLPDMSGFEVLEHIRIDEALQDLPVIVFTGRELSAEEDLRLHSMARSVVVKGVESPDRLLDETALFLHRIVANLPPEKQRMLDRLHSSDEDLANRTVLLVDDDSRNIFALSSVLERRGMHVLTATTGNEAISLLRDNPSVAIVLMDIMMPEMDGYQTMQAMRRNADWRRLPIIALTAKAMKGDREKCLEAGASDYLAKPVNTDQLLASLRTWLHR
jgi:CheY-like chemotaxis protein